MFFVLVFFLITNPDGSYELRKVQVNYENVYKCREDAEKLNKIDLTVDATCYVRSIHGI